MKTIGLIGVGIMGNGIAANYLKQGYQVLVWNRSKERTKPLVENGAVAKDSPREVAAGADIVFEVTANDESSRSVWLGENGILAGATAKTTLIASWTFSVAWIDELTDECARRDFTFFDMPLTGGRAGAENGTLTFLVGGDEHKLEDLKADLRAVSGKILYFGKAGSGIRYKLLLNALQAIHLIGLGEMLKIAEKAGMDVKKVGDALAEHPGGTTTNIAWRGYQKTPDPINFSVAWIAKDLGYAKVFAEDLNLPLLDDALEKYQKALAQGLGEKDFTEVNKNS